MINASTSSRCTRETVQPPQPAPSSASKSEENRQCEKERTSHTAPIYSPLPPSCLYFPKAPRDTDEVVHFRMGAVELLVAAVVRIVHKLTEGLELGFFVAWRLKG
jgi:hypothetical protein